MSTQLYAKNWRTQYATVRTQVYVALVEKGLSPIFISSIFSHITRFFLFIFFILLL